MAVCCRLCGNEVIRLNVYKTTSEVNPMQRILDKLGVMIKAARTDKHLTQKQLAECLSITPHYLMSIENKQQIPSCDLLFRLIRELEIPADTIFYPEYEQDNALLGKLRLLLYKCDEKEVNDIIAILQSLLGNK
jgi:transcriptional regulator with XRE-family HTH domain